MDDSQTPRGLVESLITHSRLDETVRNSTIDTSTNKVCVLNEIIILMLV